MTCNSAENLESKNPAKRTYGEIIFEKLLSLELSLKSETELKIGVADYGSGLNYDFIPL